MRVQVGGGREDAFAFWFNLCFLSKISRLALFYMVVVSSPPVTAFALYVLLACLILHCSSLR